MFLKGICEVKSRDDKDWVCKINEGLAGMSFARFSPDSRTVLTVSEFNVLSITKVKLSIWSLVNKSTQYIQFPKYSEKGLSFSSNGYFMALRERIDSKEYIGIYYVGDWTLVSVPQ